MQAVEGAKEREVIYQMSAKGKGKKHKRKKRLTIPRDIFSEMRDEVLFLILLLLPMRDAARTTILSRRWRYLWKASLASSSSLTLDPLAMRGSDYLSGMFHHWSTEFGCVENTSLLSMERSKFIQWLDQILQLDYNPVIDTFRFRFHFQKDHSHVVDRCINIAVSKRVDNLDIDLSRFVIGNYHPYEDLYTLPYRLLTPESGSLVKCLSLKCCILKPLDLYCFSRLLDLRLEHVLLDQDSFVSFLSNCPNLEKLCLVECSELTRLEISGRSLKLKDLTILSCRSLMDVVINAISLTKLEYRGGLVYFSIRNVPLLCNVILHLAGRSLSSTLSSVLQSLSNHLPKLESLMLAVSPVKENIITNKFSNLKKLVMTSVIHEGTLWAFIPLLFASPLLDRLELHWLFCLAIECEAAGATPRPSDSPLLYLKEITLGGFTGSTHEIEFTRYLLNHSPALQKLTIVSYKTKFYTHECGFHYPRSDCYGNLIEAKVACKEKMEEGTREQLKNNLKHSVELLFS